ncbi:uncharacterized protein BDW43DRAFT_183141 [Aspergillus alliaceus]|uniref:uncharacterized protein n=1 Tax=Petromyces alliaceus TaxID=209559 RepID=UPI0012A529FA|nr:uncharacterized protein BDW43DRAFT_183141 [Aspergillus alliaceus]KAB8237782.1 hypothetical protein BDW43DRAFT_183141 [Aspergillus alliaceus]
MITLRTIQYIQTHPYAYILLAYSCHQLMSGELQRISQYHCFENVPIVARQTPFMVTRTVLLFFGCFPPSLHIYSLCSTNLTANLLNRTISE